MEKSFDAKRKATKIEDRFGDTTRINDQHSEVCKLDHGEY